jgi:hypothetical protein
LMYTRVNSYALTTEVWIGNFGEGQTTIQSLTSDLAKGRMFAFGRDISAGGPGDGRDNQGACYRAGFNS